MVSVLLTRPKNASESLAHELERNGYESIIEPLLVIEPLTTPRPDISGCGTVMITSSNALETGQELAALFDLPCFCVGPRTAEKARSTGFRNVRSSSSDGTELARLIETTLKNNFPNEKPQILHISGLDIDSKAQDELTRLGHRVIVWPVYAARPVLKLTERMASLFKQQQLDAVLVFSVRTAETLKALLGQNGLNPCCEGLIAIGLSEAIVDALKPHPWKKAGRGVRANGRSHD